MPSPIAHSVTGIAIAQLFPSIHSGAHWRWQAPIQVLFAAAVALFPDIDFLAELITGEPYHRGMTHSVIFMLAFTFVLTLIGRYLFPSFSSKRFFSLALLTYGSHLVLDLLTKGKPGIQLLWPFTKNQFQSPLTLFPAARPSEQLLQDPKPILIFVLVELAYTITLLAGVWLWKNSKVKQQLNN